jgi:hypothetical protein
MMPSFFLAGLEGQSFEDLYRALAENDIDLVIDIRLPRGFSLEAALERQNELHGRRIEYRWLKYFGNPHFDRDDPHESYKGYLMGMDKELEELYDLLMRRRTCIVDDGKVPERSYRIVLAEALKKKYGIVYADLTMAKEIEEKYGAKY